MKRIKDESKQQELLPADLKRKREENLEALSADEPTHIDILLETSGFSFGDLERGFAQFGNARFDSRFAG